MSECLKLRQFRPGHLVHGQIRWVNSRSRKVIASTGFAADMRDPEDGFVQLNYSTTHRGETVRQDYRIDFETTQPHFGGVRWWFRCPLSFRRVRCLHLVGQCERFASREHLGLGYQCQRETWADRRLRAAQAIDTQLGGPGNLDAGPPPKPKWMRWPTYWRLCRQREWASLASMVGALAQIDTINARLIIQDISRDDPDLLAGSGLG